MSAGTLLTVLANIPWSQVIENAPKVADSAAKLWNAATGLRKKTPPHTSATSTPPDSTPATETQVLQMQVTALEESVRQLEAQMQASSELIKALADQNALLVQRIELHRQRLHRMGIAVTGMGIAVGAALLYFKV